MLTAFSELISSIALVVDNRNQNQSFCLAAAAHKGFSSNLMKHTALSFLAAI